MHLEEQWLVVARPQVVVAREVVVLLQRDRLLVEHPCRFFRLLYKCEQKYVCVSFLLMFACL